MWEFRTDRRQPMIVALSRPDTPVRVAALGSHGVEVQFAEGKGWVRLFMTSDTAARLAQALVRSGIGNNEITGTGNKSDR